MNEIYLYAQRFLPLIISLAVLLGIIILRKPLTRALMRIILSRQKKSNPARYRLICDTMVRPFSFMLISGAARIALEYMQISPTHYVMWANILSSVFLITSFIALYSAAGLTVGVIINNSHEKGLKVDPNAANYISSGIRITIVVIGIFTILSRWVTDISGLIAGLGIGGLALALAAQDTASNLFGSISIMLDKPFEIGDWVEMDGIMGTVIRVGLRSSQIKSLDQSIITVPNSKLAVGTISNGTKRQSRRIAFKVGVVYSTPPDKISAYTKRIEQILEADTDVKEEGIIVRFDNFADSALEIFVCYFTVTDFSAMLEVRERINLEILKTAHELGISMAFPSISLYYESAPKDEKDEKAENKTQFEKESM